MFSSRTNRIVLAASALLLLPLSAARAQAPQQTAVFPPGGQPGTTVAATIHGANLQGATAVLLSGQGVGAKITNSGNAAALAVELAVAGNAEPGSREVRVVTPRGTSNAGQFYVDVYPRLNETEPNNTPAQAQALEKFPITLNGQANAAEDVDFFAFDAAVGDTWVIDLNGQRHGSALDGFVSIRDAQGRELKTAMEAASQDPRLIFTFPKAGRYTLQVRDKLYRGGANFTYSVNVGKLPTVVSAMPLGGKRGEWVEVSLEGVNLGEMKTVRVQMPSDPAQPSIVVPIQTPAGPANPILLYAGDFSEAQEAEPNDTQPQATHLKSLPATVNGRIGGERDLDLYVFTGQAKQQFLFDLRARRLNSRLDSVVRILDKDGKEIASNDDAVGKDSRISFTVPADGDYFVEVRSLDTHGSPEHFYRLEIRPPTQNFTLTVTPDNPNIGPGGSAALTVNVAREGYGGEIAVRVDGLPAGVTASPALIRPGQNQVSFTLTADGMAAIAASQIRVIGEATLDGQKVARVATPALAVQVQEGQPPAPRPVKLHVASVTEQQPYVLQIEPRELKITQGQTLEITLKALRKMGFDAAINLQVLNNQLPPGITVQAKPIPEKQTEVKFNLVAAANAGVLTQNVIFTGVANNVLQAAPALPVTVMAK